MLKNVYIRRFFAALLLLIFAFGIIPKAVLHDVFAKHIDNHHKKTDAPVQLDQSGYNCDTDSQVAESGLPGFTHSLVFPAFIPSSFFLTKNISTSSSFSAYSRLRGPPQNI